MPLSFGCSGITIIATAAINADAVQAQMIRIMVLGPCPSLAAQFPRPPAQEAKTTTRLQSLQKAGSAWNISSTVTSSNWFMCLQHPSQPWQPWVWANTEMFSDGLFLLSFLYLLHHPCLVDARISFKYLQMFTPNIAKEQRANHTLHRSMPQPAGT